MAAVSSYPQQVETNIYWNLLKDLDEDLKIQLVTRLKKPLKEVLERARVMLTELMMPKLMKMVGSEMEGMKG